MSRHGSHDAATPKVSIGTVELRPQVTRNDRWRGLAAKCLLDVAPDEGAVEQHVGAVLGMNRRAVRLQRLLRIHDKRQRLVADADFLGGVLGQRAAVGDHRHDPFAGIACLPDRERIAPDPGRIEPVHQGIGCSAELVARSAHNGRPASPAPRTHRSKRCAPPDAATAAPRTCSMPSTATSATKRPRPATNRRSSRTLRLVETKRNAEGSAVISTPPPARRPPQPRARLRPVHRVRYPRNDGCQGATVACWRCAGARRRIRPLR